VQYAQTVQMIERERPENILSSDPAAAATAADLGATEPVRPSGIGG
jgi:hypothetical protein